MAEQITTYIGSNYSKDHSTRDKWIFIFFIRISPISTRVSTTVRRGEIDLVPWDENAMHLRSYVGESGFLGSRWLLKDKMGDRVVRDFPFLKDSSRYTRLSRRCKVG